MFQSQTELSTLAVESVVLIDGIPPPACPMSAGSSRAVHAASSIIINRSPVSSILSDEDLRSSFRACERSSPRRRSA